MRRLAEKGAFIWVVLALIPGGTLVHIIGGSVDLDSAIILAMQLPALALQLFAVFTLVRYLGK